MNIFSRYGGLTLIRQPGEFIVMSWEAGHRVSICTQEVTDTTATLKIGDNVFVLGLGETVEVPGPSDDRPANCLITVDDIGGERAAIRIVAPKRVRIIRGERFEQR